MFCLLSSTFLSAGLEKGEQDANSMPPATVLSVSYGFTVSVGDRGSRPFPSLHPSSGCNHFLIFLFLFNLIPHMERAFVTDRETEAAARHTTLFLFLHPHIGQHWKHWAAGLGCHMSGNGKGGFNSCAYGKRTNGLAAFSLLFHHQHHHLSQFVSSTIYRCMHLGWSILRQDTITSFTLGELWGQHGSGNTAKTLGIRPQQQHL